MTPEERFLKIENAIQSLTETQARHDTLIEKQNAGIRDLIVVSRTLIDTATTLGQAQKRTEEKLNALIDTVREHEGKIDVLIDTVREHEGKIDALIDTVDRIIRRDNGHKP